MVCVGFFFFSPRFIENVSILSQTVTWHMPIAETPSEERLLTLDKLKLLKGCCDQLCGVTNP